MLNTIPATDRSFLYGDGVFTTMLVQHGEICLWSLHLQRLQQSMRRLAFTEPDWLQLEQQLIQHITAPQQVLKVLLSRGQGGRGYGTAGITAPGIYISNAPVPDYSAWRQHGIRVGIASLKLSVQPLLAGLKHTSRLEQVLLKQEIQQSGYDELLAVDQQGFVTEVSAANVFFYRAGVWFTPELTRCGVAGVMRQHILNQLPQCQQVNWILDELADVEAMVVTNALMGVVPVVELNGKTLSLDIANTLKDGVLC